MKAQASGLAFNVCSEEEWEKLMQCKFMPRANTFNYYFGLVSKSSEAGGVISYIRCLYNLGSLVILSKCLAFLKS